MGRIGKTLETRGGNERDHVHREGKDGGMEAWKLVHSRLQTNLSDLANVQNSLCLLIFYELYEYSQNWSKIIKGVLK